jgi:hypothetical protein
MTVITLNILYGPVSRRLFTAIACMVGLLLCGTSVIGLGYVASIFVHIWINPSYF